MENMENPTPRCVDCPWRRAELCPASLEGPERDRALNVRLDVGPAGLIACACSGGPGETAGRRRASAFPRNGPEPYLQASDRSLIETSRGAWGALQGLLQRPLDGLASVGLSLLPEGLQDLILEALRARRPVTIRVNLEFMATGPEGLPLTALRALALQTGSRLVVTSGPAEGSPPHPWDASIGAGIPGLAAPAPD